MKTVGVREIAQRGVTACIDDSQTEGLIITKHGKPAAVMVGVEGYDMEDVMLMANPRFWELIEQRRKEPRTPLEDFERELARRSRPRARKRR